jgi:hypothetical protein
VGIVWLDYCVQTALAVVFLVLMWWLWRDSDHPGGRPPDSDRTEDQE